MSSGGNKLGLTRVFIRNVKHAFLIEKIYSGTYSQNFRGRNKLQKLVFPSNTLTKTYFSNFSYLFSLKPTPFAHIMPLKLLLLRLLQTLCCKSRCCLSSSPFLTYSVDICFTDSSALTLSTSPSLIHVLHLACRILYS